MRKSMELKYYLIVSSACKTTVDRSNSDMEDYSEIYCNKQPNYEVIKTAEQVKDIFRYL